MNQALKIGIVSDIIPADSPLMSGQGPCSTCKGDFNAIFKYFYAYAKKNDFLIGNFEAVLVDKIGKISPAESAMKSPLSIIPALKQCGFKYLSIANNHTMEYGGQQFDWMCQKFAEAGIVTIGHKDQPGSIIAKNDINIGLLAFSSVPAFYGNKPLYYYVDYKSEDDIRELLDKISIIKKKCNHLIVFPHWGHEYMPNPASWQVRLAERMADSGADAVFGAHPHIMQTSSIINGKPVFFSLGNLLSDYFQERFRRNAVITLDVNCDSMSVSGEIFSFDDDYVIQSTGKAMSDPAESIVCPKEAEYLSDTHTARARVRKELIKHMLKNFNRWAFNIGLWAWIIKRGWFLIWKSGKIRRNPNLIYSGPIH